MRKLYAIGFFALFTVLATPVLPAYADDAGVAAEVVEAEAPAEEVKLPVAVPEKDEVVDIVTGMLSHAKNGEWRLAISGLLFLLMFILRMVKLPCSDFGNP